MNSHPGIDFPIPVDYLCENYGEYQVLFCYSGYFGCDKNIVSLKECVNIDGLTTGESKNL